MKRVTITGLVILCLAISGCNTFEGMGQDVQVGGKAISNAAEKTKEGMDNTRP